MGRRRPPCGNPQAHAPHGRPVPGETFLEVCPGWCQRDADATALADRLDQIARESLWPRRLPARIRMECHPSVIGPLRNLNESAPSVNGPQDPMPLFDPYQKLTAAQLSDFVAMYRELAEPVRGSAGLLLLEPLNTGEDAGKPQIPVVVTTGMERGQWRITADDGLIAEGTVSDG